jgi:glycerophosphoryl diester phosphodiesterase
MPGEFLIFGHRGSPKRFPENTIESFEEALRAGADGFETDLRLLSDRTAVLFHDDDLGRVVVETLSFEECAARGAKIARLSDLARFAGRAKMVLEVKRGKWEEQLLEEIRDWPDIIVASFDHSVVTTLRKRGVSFPLGITFSGRIRNVGAYAADLGATWCFPKHRYVDRKMVESLKEHGIRVVPWTANRPRVWERLRALGCDGVITDYPEKAVSWREAR